MSKMYIAVREDVPDYMVPTLVAHTVINSYINRRDNSYLDSYVDLYDHWLKYSFKKCVVKVSPKQFERVKEIPHVYLGHENTVLNGEKSCGIIVVEGNHPYKVLQFAKMWGPSGQEN